MSVDLLEIPSEWKCVEESLSEMRSIREDFDAFMAETLGEFESMAEMLVRHEEHFERIASQENQDVVAAAFEDEQRFDRLIEEATQREESLKAELESAQQKASETDRLLEEQRRQAASQEAKWTDELGQMRRTLDAFASQLESAVSRPQPAPPVQAQPIEEPAAYVSDETEEVRETEDMVLDSVMDQFKMLQRDVTRRRENASG